MSINFLRKIEVQIGEIYINALDIDFQTSNQALDEGTAATATIKIWNLSKATSAKITPGMLVKLWAGYASDNGIIYLGRVIETQTETDESDTALKVTCKDYTYPVSLPSRAYPKGTPIRDILLAVYADCALPVGEIINDCGVTLKSAHTTDTDAKREIDACIALINGDPAVSSRVHHVLIGGSAYVIAKGDTTTRAHMLAASTGLIETNPDASGDSDQTATLLLNWRLAVDSLVYLDSAHQSGYYSVTGCKHIADGDKYQTELTLKSQAAP